MHTDVIKLSDRRTLRVAEASTYSGLGRSTVFKLIAEGRVASLKVGRSRLIVRESLDKLLQAEKAVA